jgi:hypothetical protein
MIGTAKREHWAVVKYVFLIPVYWLMVSSAAVMAFIQLITRPHYWEKTHHGLDLGKHLVKDMEVAHARRQLSLGARAGGKKLNYTSLIAGGSILVLANALVNVINFLNSAYLGRTLSLEEFGLVTTFGGFLQVASVFIVAFGATMTHRSAYLLGKYGKPVKEFLLRSQKIAIRAALIVTGVWLMTLPFLKPYFNTQSFIPFLLFTPVWLVGTIGAVMSGFNPERGKYETQRLESY